MQSLFIFHVVVSAALLGLMMNIALDLPKEPRRKWRLVDELTIALGLAALALVWFTG